MEFQNSDDSEGDETLDWRRLDTLPPEIILHICSFLSAKFVISVLSQVSKKFKELIECDTTWRMRIFRRWPRSYPIVPPVEDLDWKVACIEREEQYRLWSNHVENMKKYHLFRAHFGSVNVVRVIEQGRLCLSGGRDGYLKFWNLDPQILADQPTDLEDTCLMNSSHHANAWLWDIAFNEENQYIFTAGFDCNVKSWVLGDPTEPFTTYKHSTPVICLAHYGRQLVSGCYGGVVSIFDTRTSEEPVFKHKHHKKPVLCIATDDKYVISGSEDKSVVVYDKAAGKVLQRLEFEWFPLSMSYGGGQLLVGDVDNSVHVIDPRNGEFNLLHTFSTGHSKKVTGVQHSLGSIVTCSTDKTIRILEPNVDPKAIAVIESTHEVSRISWCNNVLACANVDDSVTVWLPSDMFNF